MNTRVSVDDIRAIVNQFVYFIETNPERANELRPYNIAYHPREKKAFWIARAQNVDPQLELAYKSPEERLGLPFTTRGASQWALGALVYHLITGRPPVIKIEDGKVKEWVTYEHIGWIHSDLLVFVGQYLCMSESCRGGTLWS